MILLLHPTHRKFIKLLRDNVNNGNVIFLTHRKIQKKGTKRHIGYFFEQLTV